MLNTEHCGFLIKQIHNSLEKHANNALRSQDLTLAQINTLLLLNDTDKNQLTLKEIEKQLQVAQSTAAGVVSRLEEKKFIQSFSDKTDKRIKVIAITELGKKYCETSEKHMIEMENKILGALEEAEREQFERMLKKVNNALK